MSIGNWYRVGTVSVQNGNVNIVGTNTDAQIITTLLGEGKLITNGH